MIAEVSSEEVKNSSKTIYSHRETSRKELHLHLSGIFKYDFNLLQTSIKGTDQVAIVSEIRVEDRTDKETQFEFALIKGEKGFGILNAGPKHFIPTTVAFKETSSSTKI